MLFKGSQDLAHLLLNERCHILAKRHERFLLLREVAAELVHLAAILLVLLRELARKLLLRICELAQQVSAEVFHLILVLPPLLRKLGVVLLNLVRLVTYLLGHRFAAALAPGHAATRRAASRAGGGAALPAAGVSPQTAQGQYESL